MLKLFFVIYNSVGAISGVIGPLDMPYGKCREEAAYMTMKIIGAPPWVEKLSFECEFHTERPRMAQEKNRGTKKTPEGPGTTASD